MKIGAEVILTARYSMGAKLMNDVTILKDPSPYPAHVDVIARLSCSEERNQDETIVVMGYDVNFLDHQFPPLTIVARSTPQKQLDAGLYLGLAAQLDAALATEVEKRICNDAVVVVGMGLPGGTGSSIH